MKLLNNVGVFSLLAATFLSGCASQHSDLQASYLVGEWVGKEPHGDTAKFVFQKDGSVIWFEDVEGHQGSFWPSGLQAKYTIHKKSPRWDIDIYDFKDARFGSVIFQGILQPIEKGKFKMEGMPSNHGGRPTDFDDKAIIFSKTDPNN